MTEPNSTTELQAAVGKWHSDTFSGRRPLATAKKALEEASELHIAARPRQGCPQPHETNWAAVAQECADVAIVLFALAEMGGFNLAEVALAKLEILKHRPNQKERDRERGID